jgi:hypothetical protein
LYHDNEIVFGPALNRAYELEHAIAKYPRVILDPAVADLANLCADFIAAENGEHFTDPFNVAFIERAKGVPIDKAMIDSFNAAAGTEFPVAPILLPPNWLLAQIVERVRAGRNAVSGNAKEKHDWLYGRIADRLK